MSGRMEQIGGSADFGSPKQSQTAEFWDSRLAGVEGLEPPTPGFGDRCSSQLSYTPSERAYSGRFSCRHLRFWGNSLADTANRAVWPRFPLLHRTREFHPDLPAGCGVLDATKVDPRRQS